jgi:hypothetical protein
MAADLIELTVDIVSSHVSMTEMSSGDLLNLFGLYSPPLAS